MLLHVVGGYGGELPGCRATCFRVNESIALDAGSLSSGLSLEEQQKLRHVLLSHSHADHTGSLVYISENIFGLPPGPLRLHSIRPVLDVLRDHVFNGLYWPKMIDLGVFELVEVQPNRPFSLDGLVVTPVHLRHTVPCLGFHLDDGECGLLYAADMSAEDALWDFANSRERLDAILLECSFPNRMESLARVSRHLTPRLVAEELKKLHRDVETLVFHIKPPHRDEVMDELAQLKHPRLRVAEQGRTYRVRAGGLELLPEPDKEPDRSPGS